MSHQDNTHAAPRAHERSVNQVYETRSGFQETVSDMHPLHSAPYNPFTSRADHELQTPWYQDQGQLAANMEYLYLVEWTAHRAGGIGVPAKSDFFDSRLFAGFKAATVLETIPQVFITKCNEEDLRSISHILFRDEVEEGDVRICKQDYVAECGCAKPGK